MTSYVKSIVLVARVRASTTAFHERGKAYGHSQVGALDFRHIQGQHLIGVSSLSVEPVAFARTCPSSSACSLFS